MAQPKAGNKEINNKNSKNISNVKETTDTNTIKHFENGNLEKQSYFPKEENVNGKNNISNDIKIVAVVGNVIQPENRNFITKVNSYSSDFIHEGSMTIVSEDKYFSIATKENDRGGHSKNKKNLTEPSTDCIDFKKGFTDMASGNYDLGVATNLQSTISKKLSSIVNITMDTGQKTEKSAGNEKVLTKDFFKTNTEKHFENESLEERGSFPNKENLNGKKNIANNIKIVAVVGSDGSVIQPENGNVLTKVNTYFSDSIHEDSMTNVAEGKHFGIATSNHDDESGGQSENKKILAEPSTYCIDFLKGSTDMIGSNYHLGVATNLQNTISEKLASNANMTMITGQKREEPTGNERVLTKEFFKEDCTRAAVVSLQSDATQNTISEKKIPHSGTGDMGGNNRSLLCKICVVSFSCFKSLEDHLRCTHIVESSFKYFNCEWCYEEFQAPSFLMTHLINCHTEEKIYSCGECGTRFPFPHSTTARRITKLYCGRCQTVFSDAKFQNMRNQSEKRLPTVENIHRCEFCQEVFSLKFAFERHLRISHGVKPHVCKVCGRKFGFPTSLKRHLQLHGAEPRKVKKIEARVEHVPKEKPYLCKICGKTFGKKIGLHCHSRTHILKYSCDSCEKAFSKKHVFRRHQLQHLREKRMTCKMKH